MFYFRSRHPDEYLAEIEKLKNLADARLLQPYRSAADVLMVFDTESYYHLGINQEADPVSHMLVNWTTLAAYRSGIVFDPIHLMDLAKIVLSAYKVIVFANVFKLNPQQKSFIRDHVSKNGRHLVWIYAPGYTDGERNAVKFVSEVTDIKLKPIQLNRAPEIEMDHSIGENLRIKIGQAPFTPIFSVQDRKARVLGRWSETNEAAVARKNHKNYTSWYFALPPMDERILRYVFKQAGAHIYGDSGAIFYAGNGILAVHTKTKDNRTVTLKNGRQIRLDFSKYSGTVAIDSNNGELLTP